MGLEDRKPLAGNVNHYAKGGKAPLTVSWGVLLAIIAGGKAAGAGGVASSSR